MRVGFVGTGNMGRPMAANILKAGHQLTVWDLRHEATRELENLGATRANDLPALSSAVRVTLLSLPNDAIVEKVVFGDGGPGLMAGAHAGDVIFDLSTVSPATTRRLSERAAAKGVRLIDAPVSGSVSGAQAGTLAVMIGASKDVIAPFEAVLRAIGTNLFCLGEVGRGNVLKLLNNLVALTNQAALCEAMALARPARRPARDRRRSGRQELGRELHSRPQAGRPGRARLSGRVLRGPGPEGSRSGPRSGGVGGRANRARPRGVEALRRGERRRVRDARQLRVAQSTGAHPRPAVAGRLATASLCPLGSLQALDPLRPLDPFGTFHALDSLDPFRSLHPLDSFRPFDALHSLDAFEALRLLEPFRMAGALETVTRFDLSRLAKDGRNRSDHGEGERKGDGCVWEFHEKHRDASLLPRRVRPIVRGVRSSVAQRRLEVQSFPTVFPVDSRLVLAQRPQREALAFDRFCAEICAPPGGRVLRVSGPRKHLVSDEDQAPQHDGQRDDVRSSEPSFPGKHGGPQARREESDDCREIEEESRATGAPVWPLHERYPEAHAEYRSRPDAGRAR